MNEMDMVVNRLPVKTWNHLHMNESSLKAVHIAGEGALRAAGPKLKPDESLSRAFDSIAGGVGRDLDLLAAQAGVKVASFTSEAGGTEPLKLQLSYGEGDAVMNRIGLTVREGQRLDVIMDYRSEPLAKGLAAVQTKIHVHTGGRLRLIQLQRMGDKYTFINDIGVQCEEDGDFELIQMVFSGHRTYMGCEAALKGDYSTFKGDIAYAVSGEDSLDINDVVRHMGKHTECEINAAGSLSNRARKLFRGTIDFAKGAKGAVGNEKEEVLLVDETVVNQTIPLILCAEEDVVGNHGATIGRPAEELLFYLTSRGISVEEAYRILKNAKLEAVCTKIWDETVRQELLDFLHEGQLCDDAMKEDRTNGEA